jgi:acyl carrier protein
MIPSAFVTLERLALTENGKVDRKALRPPALAEAHAAPANDTERRLVTIAGEILGIQAVSTQTNLFELGLTSVQLVRLARRVEQEFDRAVPVVELFRLPTLAALAVSLTAAPGDSEHDADGALASEERAGKRRAMMAARHGRRGRGLE